MEREVKKAYETKCRRCGHLTDWTFGDLEGIKADHFIVGMFEFIDHPRQRFCAKCNKDTVQDLVSFQV